MPEKFLFRQEFEFSFAAHRNCNRHLRAILTHNSEFGNALRVSCLYCARDGRIGWAGSCFAQMNISVSCFPFHGNWM